MPSKRLKAEIHHCAIKNKYYTISGKGKWQKRFYLCPHKKFTWACSEGDCAKNKQKTPKSKLPCRCGSGVTLAFCRNPTCDAEGKGSAFCKKSGKQKVRCPCGAKGCGGALCNCEKKVIRETCKTCGGIDYEIYLTRQFGRHSLTQQSKSKTNVHKYVKLSSHDFRIYIEKTFKEGMTWDNYGQEENKWTIGHAKPIKYKNPTDEQIIKRLHYKNTFAQWWVDNQEQGNDKIVDINIT